MDRSTKSAIEVDMEGASFVIQGARASGYFTRRPGDEKLVELWAAYRAWSLRTLSHFGSDEPEARFWCAVELHSAFVENLIEPTLGRPAAGIRLDLLRRWMSGDYPLMYRREIDGPGDDYRHITVPPQTEFPSDFVA